MSVHELLVTPLQYEFMRRGLLTAVLVGVSGGLLGCILMLRRLALMGDALSHSLLPGISLAYLVFGTSTAALFGGALLAGLFTAFSSAFLSRLTRLKEDAAFGAIFLMLFAAGVAIASRLPARVDMMHILFGNILGVRPSDLGLAAGACGVTVLAFLCGYRPILLQTFDPVFHRSVSPASRLTHLALLGLVVVNLTAALQAMGVVLALGLFLLPAVTAYLWCERFGPMLVVSAAIAAAGSFAGLLLSFHARLASGASIVLCLGAIFLLSALVSPRHGLLGAARRR
jgi:zinc/manganese transport system permease protein